MSAALNLQPGDAMPQQAGFKANKGKLPREATGERVTVELRNGRICVNWAANTTRWTLTDDGWDVAFYRVLG